MLRIEAKKRRKHGRKENEKGTRIEKKHDEIKKAKKVKQCRHFEMTKWWLPLAAHCLSYFVNAFGLLLCVRVFYMF